MHELAHRPPTVAIRCFQLSFRQTFHCGAKLRRSFRNFLNRLLTQRGRNGCGHLKITDGVTWIHRAVSPWEKVERKRIPAKKNLRQFRRNKNRLQFGRLSRSDDDAARRRRGEEGEMTVNATI